MTDATLIFHARNGGNRLQVTCAGGEGDTLDMYYDGVSVAVTMVASAETRAQGEQPMVILNDDMVKRLAAVLPSILDRAERDIRER